jgi:mRNA-degrading endonuclease YafQ of YafQ-DinJ toxin-antitoxin module
MYQINFYKDYKPRYKKIVKNDEKLKHKISKTLRLLANNPKHRSLKSHKVNTKHYGYRWSSWVTGDIRVIWDFDQEGKLIILVLSIGKHSGKFKVYK